MLDCGSCLPWGHKPHPLVGFSCLTYAVLIPVMLPCHPVTAALFGLVTVSSYLSDHVYTGLTSAAHAFDRIVAPTVFMTALHVVYVSSGLVWMSSSLLAVACHLLAHDAAKRGEYGAFVIWHSMWHFVGQGLICLCFWYNDAVHRCMP